MSTRHISQRGFTMIELAVTISIFAVLVSVVFTNYRSFSSGAEFTNIGEDLVLALREAQIYGLGSKGATGVSCTLDDVSSPFNCAYGVYFSNSNQGSYVIFVDKDNNGVYTNTTDDTLIRTASFNGKARISDVACSDACGTATQASVTFKRPSPDAVIKSSASDLVGAKSVAITLVNQDNSKTEVITVTQTGQVSLKKL